MSVGVNVDTEVGNSGLEKNHDLFDLNQIFFIRIRIPVYFQFVF